MSGSGRAGYLAPAYTWLFAAGAVGTEQLVERRLWQRLRPALFALVGSTLLLAPLGLPILPVATYVRYAETLRIQPSTEERKEVARLPQHYADMHGWEEIIGAVAVAYGMLTPTEQEHSVVFAQNYGVAGAIDFLGRARGLPRAVSGHNNYWLWGPGEGEPQAILIVGGDRDDHTDVCGQLEAAAVIDCGDCMPYENDQIVFVCRELKRSAAELWPAVKHYD